VIKDIVNLAVTGENLRVLTDVVDYLILMVESLLDFLAAFTTSRE